MRALTTTLHEHGVWMLGFRVPGHGMAPASLTDITRRDFAAAVRLAAKHVAEQVPGGRPLFIAGYSNGATLAAQYSLAVVAGEGPPRPQGSSAYAA